MIELYNIIGFIVCTVFLVLLEWFVYSDKRRALKLIPVAMVLSGIINAVWVLL